MSATPEELNNLSERIIGCAYMVSNKLGAGFLEKVYENALAHELRKAGIHCQQQVGLKVTYDGVIVGEYATDLLAEECVILELKASRAIEDAHVAQCLNYLKATGIDLCLLINFGKPKVEVKRIVNGSKFRSV